MFCPKCGAQVAEDTKFCGHCGYQVAARGAAAASVGVMRGMAASTLTRPSKRLLASVAVVVAAALVAVLVGHAALKPKLDPFGMLFSDDAGQAVKVLSNATETEFTSYDDYVYTSTPELADLLEDKGDGVKGVVDFEYVLSSSEAHEFMGSSMYCVSDEDGFRISARNVEHGIRVGKIEYAKLCSTDKRVTCKDVKAMLHDARIKYKHIVLMRSGQTEFGDFVTGVFYGKDYVGSVRYFTNTHWRPHEGNLVVTMSSYEGPHYVMNELPQFGDASSYDEMNDRWDSVVDSFQRSSKGDYDEALVD